MCGGRDSQQEILQEYLPDINDPVLPDSFARIICSRIRGSSSYAHFIEVEL